MGEFAPEGNRPDVEDSFDQYGLNFMDRPVAAVPREFFLKSPDVFTEEADRRQAGDTETDMTEFRL